MLRSSLRLIVLGCLLAGIVLPGFVWAQQQVTGLTVTPAVIKTAVSRETPSQQTKLTIRNNYEVPVRLSAELKDIDETTPQLLPGDDLEPDLREVLVLSETDLTIPPRTDAQITLQATYNDSLKPGGHYAAIVLTEQSPTGASLSLRSAVSVTVFLTNQEGVKEEFELRNFSAPSSLFSLPEQATVELVNTGNVHSVPRGVVRVERQNGGVLAKGVLNTGSQPVLPGRSFNATIPLGDIANSFWPQKIRTVLEFHGDTSTQITEASKVSWYIPPGFIGLIVLTAGILVLFFRFGLIWVVKTIRSIKPKLGRKKRAARPIQPVQIQDVVKVNKKQR